MGQFYEGGNTRLMNLALTVSGACRDLIKASWGLSMAPWKQLETQTAGFDAGVWVQK
jgi:hypothetical protein